MNTWEISSHSWNQGLLCILLWQLQPDCFHNSYTFLHSQSQWKGFLFPKHVFLNWDFSFFCIIFFQCQGECWEHRPLNKVLAAQVWGPALDFSESSWKPDIVRASVSPRLPGRVRRWRQEDLQGLWARHSSCICKLSAPRTGQEVEAGRSPGTCRPTSLAGTAEKLQRNLVLNRV